MRDRLYNTLFLCTGNSARSIIAEAILNKVGVGRFKAFSAGSHPTGSVHPETIRLLRSLGYDTSQLRSKSWAEFTGADTPEIDFVFTVCDNAAAEACPVWPGKPTTAHWGVSDPAQASGSATETAIAFRDAYRTLNQRIEKFISLPIGSLDVQTLKSKLQELGRT